MMKRIWMNIRYRMFFQSELDELRPDLHVFLIDIDNTLADTWPTLNPMEYPSHHDRLKSLAVFRGLYNYVKPLVNKPGTRVIFISARPLDTFELTGYWLYSCGLKNDNTRLILVYEAQDKLYYIKKAIKNSKSLTYIDDLSFGHENGQVQSYDDVVMKVKQLPLTYIGYKEIQEINHI